MHRIFSGDGWLEVLGIRVASGKAFAFEPGFAEMGEPSHRHVSRVTGASQRAPVGFQRSRPPDTLHRTIGTTHPGARASRPHPLPWVAAQFPCDGAPVHRAGGNRMGPAQAEPGCLCRSIRVEEMAEALPVLCGRDARAPGWASSHDVVEPKEFYPSSCLFEFVRASSSFPKRKRLAVSPLNDPSRREGRGDG